MVLAIVIKSSEVTNELNSFASVTRLVGRYFPISKNVSSRGIKYTMSKVSIPAMNGFFTILLSRIKMLITNMKNNPNKIPEFNTAFKVRIPGSKIIPE